MNVDRGNRNCYNYRGFGHLVRNCRNRRIEGRMGKGRRLKYKQRNNGQRMIKEENGQNNLNEEQDLILLN